MSNDTRRFRPETLTCRPGQNRSTCLTTPQISAVRHVYSDYYEANQTYIFGPYYPGGEAGYATAGYVGNAPDTLDPNVFRFFFLKYVACSIKLIADDSR